MPIKSRQLCRIELRSREVWPAGLEPAPRRVSGDRSTVAELRPHGDGRGWTRTSSLLFVRQALYAIELLAREYRGRESNPHGRRPRRSRRRAARRPGSGVFAHGGRPRGRSSCCGLLRDKGSNLDLHVQSVVSCRLDDPGMVVRAYVTLGSMPNDVFHASRLPFNPGSPSVRCALCDGRRPTWRSFGARCSVADGKSAC